MARRIIEIAGEVFLTQKAAKERVRGIMASYQDGEEVNIFDLEFMRALLERHPEGDRKIGCGIAAIYVDRNPIYTSTRTFFVRRLDGSSTDFSYLECLRPTSHEKKVWRAFRAAIEPFTMQYKQMFFEYLGEAATCPITGETINFANCHIDHAPPNTFESLARAFLKTEGLSTDDIEIADHEDHNYRDRLTDTVLEHRWINYHNTRANLRAVSKQANLSILRTDNGRNL